MYKSSSPVACVIVLFTWPPDAVTKHRSEAFLSSTIILGQFQEVYAGTGHLTAAMSKHSTVSCLAPWDTERDLLKSHNVHLLRRLVKAPGKQDPNNRIRKIFHFGFPCKSGSRLPYINQTWAL